MIVKRYFRDKYLQLLEHKLDTLALERSFIFSTSLSSVLGYFAKSSGLLNWVGLTKILTTEISFSFSRL
jgi:hypothetical protein